MTVYQRYRSYLQVAGISHGGKGSGPRLTAEVYPDLMKKTGKPPLMYLPLDAVKGLLEQPE